MFLILQAKDSTCYRGCNFLGITSLASFTKSSDWWRLQGNGTQPDLLRVGARKLFQTSERNGGSLGLDETQRSDEARRHDRNCQTCRCGQSSSGNMRTGLEYLGRALFFVREACRASSRVGRNAVYSRARAGLRSKSTELLAVPANAAQSAPRSRRGMLRMLPRWREPPGSLACAHGSLSRSSSVAGRTPLAPAAASGRYLGNSRKQRNTA